MIGRPRMFKKRRHKGRRCAYCGARATYHRKDGSQASDADHDLCADCFANATRRGLSRWGNQ